MSMNIYKGMINVVCAVEFVINPMMEQWFMVKKMFAIIVYPFKFSVPVSVDNIVQSITNRAKNVNI
jgi:hypothetical protein